MTALVASAYVLTMILVIRSRTHWVFSAYLAAELFRVIVFQPERIWIFLYADPFILALQIAAAIEAWLYVTWCLPSGERKRSLLLAVACGMVGVFLMMYHWHPDHLKIPEWFGAWPPDPRMLPASQGRLLAQILAFSIALVPAAWELTHPGRRRIPGSRSHSWTMALYLGAFVLANSYFASEGMEQWNHARQIFRIAILTCLALWCLQAVSAIRRASSRAPSKLQLLA